MIDPNLLLRTWLLTPSQVIDGTLVQNPVLAAFTNQNPAPALTWPTGVPIFAGHLAEKYDPRQNAYGPAIVVRVGGSGLNSGGTASPEMPVILVRMQIIVWAGINEYLKARTFDRAIFDWLHGRCNVDLADAGFVMSCLNHVLGQDVNDSASGYATVLSFWQLMLREN